MSGTTSRRSLRCGRYALVTVTALVFVACAGSDNTADTSVIESTALPVDTETPTTDSATTTTPTTTTTVAPTTTTDPPIASDPPTSTPLVEPEVTGVVPARFTTTMVRITKADGSVCDVCLWLADEPAERNRGLMDVTDLGNAQGMIFRFEQPTLGSFFMFQTVTPLSIAWFAPDGAHVSSTDMEPCLEENSVLCERFAPTGTYQSAIEVFQGDFDAIGISAGSSVEILDGTEALVCPAIET